MAGKNKSEPQTFSTRKECYNWMSENGYKISQAKFYEDSRTMLVIQRDGSVKMKDLKNYLVTAGVEQYSGSRKAVLTIEQIRAEKERKELEKLQLDIDTKQFKLDVEQGKYIPREEFELEMCARVAVMYTTFRRRFKERFSEEDREFAFQVVDEVMNELARTDRFEVIFESN